MAEIKISDLTPKGANLIATDLLVISEDIGGGLYETKSITGDEVLNAVAKTAVAVRNQTGATIYKGTIVYISGASGGKALISKAQANSEATSSKTLGVVTADIANNANGNVLTNGLLTDLDTRTTATNPFTADTLAIGDDLYLSPTNAGYVTNVKPIAPNNLVNIGKVLETSGATGQILYAIVNGYELGELHDVDTTGAVTGNVLALDGGIWKPTTISTGLTIGTTPITSGTVGRVLFEGAGNVAQEDSAFFWDNTNKRLGVGATPNTSTRLDIRAQGALSTDIAFRVRNSADTFDIIRANGLGDVFIGLGAGRVNTGTQNVFFGQSAGYNNTGGGYNSFFGESAGKANVGAYDNSFFGALAGTSNTGQSNSYFGSGAGRYINSTSFNTIIGRSAGLYINGGAFLTAADNSVFLGFDTRALANNQTNQIVIGYNAIGGGNNTATLGNTSIVKTILRGTINAANLPTSSAGLVTGDIWNNGGVLNIV